MVIMASSIVRGSKGTTTTKESRNMAAILQNIIGSQSHAALFHHVLLWYWISMLWSIDTSQNKVSADQYHESILWAQVYNSSRSHVFLKLTTDKVLVFDWIAGSCQVKLLKQGRIVQKPVNTSPGLKFMRSITFSSMQMFFAALFCVYGDYKTQNRKPNNKQKTSLQSYKTQIKFYFFLG